MTSNDHSPYSIQPATVQQAPLVHALLQQLENSLGKTGQISRRESDVVTFGFGADPCFEALLAWQGVDGGESAAGEAVGLVVLFREFSTWRGRPGVYVQDLFVARPARGTGLGKALMRAAFERGRDWGATYCRLAVSRDNPAAVAFYESMGFAVAGDDHIMMRDGLAG